MNIRLVVRKAALRVTFGDEMVAASDRVLLRMLADIKREANESGLDQRLLLGATCAAVKLIFDTFEEIQK